MIASDQGIPTSIDEYLVYIAKIRRLSEHTIKAYKQDLRYLSDYAQTRQVDPSELTRDDARRFTAQLVRGSLSPATINRILSGIRGYYAYRIRFGMQSQDPFDRIRSVAGGRRLPEVLTVEEVEAFLEAPGDDFLGIRDRVVFTILYATGCRLSELLTASEDNVDLAATTLTVLGKGGKQRTTFLTDEACELLSLYIPLKTALQSRLRLDASDRRALIVNNRGERLTAQGVHHIFRQYERRLGISKHVTPHTFRHSFATHILDNDAGIRTVQELLGHANISTTQIYTHVSANRLRGVYETAHPHGGKKREE